MDRENLYRPEQPMDDDLQKELDAALGDMNLEDLIDLEAGKKPKSKSNDKLITATVISIQGDDIFVDIGGRSEAVLPAAQFSEEPLPAEGSTIEVMIEGYDRDGMLKVTREGAIKQAAWDTLTRGQVVEGRVTGMNKGGLELMIDGIRAFMPISQIDLNRVEELDPYLNQRLECEVSEIDHANENLVVSRRALLKKQQAAKAEDLWETIHVGMVVQGTVRSIQKYGAFVDIGGADGLLHIKDLAYSRVEKTEDIVHVGQKVEVKVISLDTEARKIGLGLKQTQADPWESVEAKFPLQSEVNARVVKLMDFGAFVELEPGIEGLVPISELSHRRIGHPKEVVSVGDMIRARVMKIDPAAQRMSLSIKQAGDDPWIGAESRWPVGSMAEGVVTRIADFGAFVELAAGVEGLIHISQVSDKRINQVKGHLNEGQTVNARVVEVDEQRRRIGLSLKKEADTSQQEAEGSMADLQAVQQKMNESTGKKPLKGGLDGGTAQTKFGELRLG